MVDVDRLVRLLDYIGRDVDVLAGAARRGAAALLADGTALDAVKYRFVTAIEGCTRVAHHIAASEGWGAADSNADAVRLLAQHAVVDRDVAERVAQAVGFRNVLVHQYAEVRDDLVAKRLEQLDDLLDFTRSVARWLDSA